MPRDRTSQQIIGNTVHSALDAVFSSAQGALGWRIRRLLGDDLVDRTIIRIAPYWRPLLKNPLMVGVTGSAGKTTTKELLLLVLRSRGRGVGTRGTSNELLAVAQAILRVGPYHHFCVAELSEDRPGAMDQPLALLRPSIGVVTTVRDDHLAAFASRDELAAEMAKLVACLPPTGTAVLNADDERVLAMATRTTAKVITYGTSPTADLRAEDISAVWPERLQFTLVHNAERVKVRTQLCGAHWIPSVLGAVGAGLAAGMSLAECAEGIAGVAPFEGRMQPVTTPEGVTFIRDDFKAPLWTLDACFDFMKAAHARRKIIVIGEVSEVGSSKELTYARAAQRAQEIAELTIIVGPWASSALKARRPGREDALRVYGHVRDAAEYVNSVAREGDLILLKGTNKQDHLMRIILARSGDVACWRDDCRRKSFCTECLHRNNPTALPTLRSGGSVLDAPRPDLPSWQGISRPDELVIVGLGNPESRYAGTPHNVGYEVIDQLAASLGLAWSTYREAWVARGTLQDRSMCLIKLRAPMNQTGVRLKQLSDSTAITPEQCILVHDDLDLPLGTVRARQSGGAGGHRGVASVLEAFQSDAFGRVKIGVARARLGLDRLEYVLTPFDVSSRAAIDRAIVTAESRILEIIRHRLHDPQREFTAINP